MYRLMQSSTLPFTATYDYCVMDSYSAIPIANHTNKKL